MITILCSWVLLFVVFLSFGEMTVHAWNRMTGMKGIYSTIDKFWIGLCSIGTLLLYISIFSPLNKWWLASILIISLVYWVWKIRTLSNLMRSCTQQWKKLSVVEKITLTLVFVVILIYSLSTPLIYDEGLYHLQSMQWSEQFKTVLGLGNLHGRLGFNSSFLLLSTVFNYTLPKELLFFSLNSLCLLSLALWLTMLMAKSTGLARGIAPIALILLTALFSLGPNISSTSTDLLPNILIIYLLIQWAIAKNSIHQQPLLFLLLPAFCITLKLSSAVIVLLSLIALYSLYSNKNKKGSLVGLAICLLVATPWIVRFILLTGYIIYPFPAIDIVDVDWKIPIEMVEYEKDIAYAWARVPQMDTYVVLSMSITEWLPLWFARLSSYNITIYILAFISPLLLIIWRAKGIMPWLIGYIGIFFGLLTAPDFRFSYGFLIVCATIPFILQSRQQKRPHLQPYVKVVTLAGLVGLVYIACSQISTYQQIESSRTWVSLMYRPQSIDLLQKKANIAFEEYKLKNSTIFVPHPTNQCFDQAIPCAPYYNNNLEMRGSEIQDGFKIKK